MTDPFYQEIRWLELKLKILDTPAYSSFIHSILAEKRHFSHILECGTGAGDFVTILEKLVTFDSLTGIDRDARLIGRARERFTHNPRIHFKISDLEDMKKLEVPQEFDLVTGHALLEHTCMADIIPVLKNCCKVGGFLYFPHNYMSPTIFEPVFDPVIDRQIIRNFDAFSIENQPNKEKLVGNSRCGANIYTSLVESGLEVIHYQCTDWLLYPKNGGYTEEESEILRMLVNFFYNANKNPQIPSSDRISDKILNEWHWTRLSQVEENKLVYLCPQTSILVRRPG